MILLLIRVRSLELKFPLAVRGSIETNSGWEGWRELWEKVGWPFKKQRERGRQRRAAMNPLSLSVRNRLQKDVASNVTRTYQEIHSADK